MAQKYQLFRINLKIIYLMPESNQSSKSRDWPVQTNEIKNFRQYIKIKLKI